MHIGIDYGSKLAGTSAIAHFSDTEGRICFSQGAAKRDADRFILDWIEERRPEQIFLDAPLSLPGVYVGREGCNDYFYRAGDRELKAMSPMFLGGLTARAMQLRSQILALYNPLVQEVYPGALARHLSLGELGYKAAKENMPACLAAVHPLLPCPAALPDNWHQFDALLAWLTGHRHAMGQHLVFGHVLEGAIWV